MSDFKYLKDGRKVIVIGKINNLEYIVQEIFVTEKGDEIPSGEKFTTKNLHDEPVTSWEQKRKAERQEELKRVENHLDRERKELRRLQEYNREYRRLVKSAGVFSKVLSPGELEVFEAVMTGTIEWLVIGDWGIGELVEFDDWIVKESTNYYNGGLRLIEVFGKRAGDLSYQAAQYSDGSGSKTKIHPFIDRDTAIEFIKGRAIDRIENDRFSISDFNDCQNLAIKIPVKLLRKVKSRLLASVKKSNKKEDETQKSNQEKRQTALQEIQNMI